MNSENGFRNRFRNLLNRLTPEKVVGAGGLAVFGATAVLAFDPTAGAGTALTLWLGNLGLNVLAGIVQQAYENLRQQQGQSEEARLNQLAQALEQGVAEDSQLRAEIGALLNETNALAIAEEIVKDNPAVHGWLIFRISQDVQQYRGDFDQIHQSIEELKQLVANANTADHEAALKVYLETVARQTGRLPLGPLDPSGRESTQLSLHQVFISLNAGVTINLTSKNANHVWVFFEILAHIYFNTHMILLGDPGSGKSTLLRHLTYLLANSLLEPDADWEKDLVWTEFKTGLKEKVKETIDEVRKWEAKEKRLTRQTVWPVPFPIPILLNLRDLAATDFDPASSTAIWEFVTRQLENQHLAQAIVALQTKGQQGELIFLLDGVDEVPLSKRPQIWQALRAHDTGVYGGNRWVATCRILSFSPEEAPKVLVQTIEPFDETQINDFIGRWYGGLQMLGELTQEKAAVMTQQLQMAVRREGLRPLAKNPMLLTIMALVQTYYGTLPDERAKLYQQCVETLLLRWQRHKEDEQTEELPGVLVQLGTTQANLERLLWEISWQAHSQQDAREEAADIPEIEVIRKAKKYLGSYAKAEQFVEYTERRAHLLVGRGGQNERIFTFPHRTFQEYLAACHLASQRRFGHKAVKLVAESDSWREVLNLTVGTLVFNQKNWVTAIDGIDDFCPKELPDENYIVGWRQIWLAGEMAAVVGKNALQMDEEKGQQMLPRLQSMLSALLDGGRLTTQQRAEAGTALSILGDPRPGVCTKEPLMKPVITGHEKFRLRRKNEIVTLQPFTIARYPVTNAQFGYFLEDGGYRNRWRDCWSDKGWRWKERDGWVEPRYWRTVELNQANQPVVGVSWYEAEAYCNWLSQSTGNTYRLPSEAEWERAAGHNDGREYPWVGEWEDSFSNTSEAGLGRSSAVGMFPSSQAVCGADDFAGNVLEWTSSWYDADRGMRVLRGGSWLYLIGKARVNISEKDLSHLAFNSFGFRVVSPIKSSF